MTVQQALNDWITEHWTDYADSDDVSTSGFHKDDGVWRDREATLRHEREMGRAVDISMPLTELVRVPGWAA